MRKKIILFLLILHHQLNAQMTVQSQSDSADRKQLAVLMESSLKNQILNRWYPLAVDTIYGGFLTSFSYDFKPTADQSKMIVTQSRHTWVNSKAAMRYPEKSYYRKAAKIGFHFLAGKMWDKEYGGFYTRVTRNGDIPTGSVSNKDAYGNAFGLYALCAYYQLSKDSNALSLAQKTFYWLEQHSHDPVYKGYFQFLQRDGTPVVRKAGTPATDATGYKDQNSSIHLLEALTALYEVWKNALVRERLQEMLLLIRDRITTARGNLTLFFQPDWTPVSLRDSSRKYIIGHHNLDYVSFGHDIETAYLMLEASHALGIEQDTTTLFAGKRMVDHALHNGWDKKTGGFYDEGYYFKGDSTITILKETKNWWAQAEGLNSLLMMSDYFPNDSNQYFQKFKLQWNYVQTYLIDPDYGGWFEEGLDKEPERRTGLKGHIWKATYHEYRAMCNCVDRLNKRQ
jgi:mannobiose 2-epimerase